MKLETFRAYCLAKKGVTEHFPFDETTLVFKVMGKMFALTDILAENFSINLKADPEKAVEQREEYSFVLEGFHMSKKHWNTILADQCPKDSLLKEWTDDSYNLVVAGLTKKQKEEFKVSLH